MSRIGRMPIKILDGVSIKEENGLVTVSGKLGTLSQKISSKDIFVETKDGELLVQRKNEDKKTKAMHGLYRKLISNMVVGVTEGFTKTLIMKGVGYKGSVSGNKMVLNMGMSHPVEIIAPEGITLTCSGASDNTSTITVKGISKELVGHTAAVIKAKRPIEPYHGYGIRYSTEAVVLKEGKTAGK